MRLKDTFVSTSAGKVTAGGQGLRALDDADLDPIHSAGQHVFLEAKALLVVRS